MDDEDEVGKFLNESRNETEGDDFKNFSKSMMLIVVLDFHDPS